MSDTLLELVATYGAGALLVTTFLSCLALPVPASLAMLAAGGFVAAGELSGTVMMAAAFGGAVLGDHAGFAAGRLGTGALDALSADRAKGRMLRTAADDLRRRGVALVFFSRWLVSPLGPYVNFAAGATGLAWSRFLLADLAGEAVWVLCYIGLGYLFAENVGLLADVLGSLTGLLAALAIAAVALVWLIRAAARHRAA